MFFKKRKKREINVFIKTHLINRFSHNFSVTFCLNYVVENKTA